MITFFSSVYHWQIPLPRKDDRLAWAEKSCYFIQRHPVHASQAIAQPSRHPWHPEYPPWHRHHLLFWQGLSNEISAAENRHFPCMACHCWASWFFSLCDAFYFYQHHICTVPLDTWTWLVQSMWGSDLYRPTNLWLASTYSQVTPMRSRWWSCQQKHKLQQHFWQKNNCKQFPGWQMWDLRAGGKVCLVSVVFRRRLWSKNRKRGVWSVFTL